jgi:hypothetical protein
MVGVILNEARIAVAMSMTIAEPSIIVKPGLAL